MKYFFYILIFFLFSCTSDEFSEEEYIDINYEAGEENLVSGLSVEAFTAEKAFGRSIPGLSNLELAFFGIGNAMFEQSWVSAPATTTSRDGLGPIFNARACATCHSNDGRGTPILENGAVSEGFLIRLSSGNDLISGPIGIANYGGQLQDNSNLGMAKEATINVHFETITGSYSDGEGYEIRKPTYTIVNENYGSLNNPKQSPRVGPQVIGLGFIDALSEASILANEDINDIDGDGISGKANYVWNVRASKSTIGKFGWKANQPTLEQQVAGAFNGDMGLTSSLFPDENCPHGVDCSKLNNGNNVNETVEVPDTQMSRIMVYQAAISVPKRRDFKTLDVLEGKQLFNDLACVICHVNNFTTGNDYSLLKQLENIIIRPYSDFLLHDMGDELADNRADFLADRNEWRTQPLWGLGLIEEVNKHTFLLHDGRARNIEEAILWHGGEAENAKNNFKNLSKEKREQLLKFLNSL
ncbi:di-heme oxidoredictase family protein [Polaribacter sp. HaHaR_3_91]|uniref:di-heme oxidoreductase family protein n=1 Tax=Polaribacter sp. HaHaR_3_91 TaxID=2745561 RepID=UPI001C4E43F5|nr:di-heme oxidoredictase family protein [Polaribacter sp. HaHaR_3_91]QXP62328.1 thiol oxidoreductase [Polaribacter sp. HaHaR_3_91]